MDSVVRHLQEDSLYSPWQIFWGSLFGGPFALTYFLRRNFQKLEKRLEAQRTLLVGLGSSFGVLLVLMVLTWERVDTAVFIACAVFGKTFSHQRQFNNAQVSSSGHVAHSHWRVLGITLGCLFLWFCAVVSIVLVLEASGFKVNA